MVHPAFDPPNDTNARIWRYMDFTKFVSMLENQGLFFSRVDLIGDPFEGSYTRVNIERRKSTLPGITDDEKIEEFFRLLKEQRPYMLLNCWHMNDQESAAMWKLYTKTNESIAIQSRYNLLRSVLPSKADIGVVHYIDYEKDFVPEGNALYAIMHKRKSFEHERELRAVWWLRADKSFVQGAEKLPPPPDSGLWLPINLDQLVEALYVAPTRSEERRVGKECRSRWSPY